MTPLNQFAEIWDWKTCARLMKQRKWQGYQSMLSQVMRACMDLVDTYKLLWWKRMYTSCELLPSEIQSPCFWVDPMQHLLWRCIVLSSILFAPFERLGKPSLLYDCLRDSAPVSIKVANHCQSSTQWLLARNSAGKYWWELLPSARLLLTICKLTTSPVTFWKPASCISRSLAVWKVPWARCWGARSLRPWFSSSEIVELTSSSSLARVPEGRMCRIPSSLLSSDPLQVLLPRIRL